MHRSQHLTWIAALVVLGVPSMGCRNTNSDGTISVQPQYSSLAERLKGPQARLGSSGRSAADRLGDDSSPTESEADGSKFSLSDQADPKNTNSSDVASAFSTEEMQVLEEAFANATPEIRELAMRRIAAQRAQEKAGAEQSGKEQGNPLETAQEQTSEKPPTTESGVQQASAVSSSAPSESPAETAADDNTADAAPEDATEAVASSSKGTDPNQFEMPDLTESTSKASSPSIPKRTEDALSPTDSTTAPANATATESPRVAAATVPSESSKTPVNASAESPAATAALTTPTGSSQVDSATASPQAPSIDSLSDAQLIEELITRHSKRAEESNDQSLPDLIRVRTLQILANRPDDAMAEIEGWSSAEREYINQQMLTLWHLTDPAGHPVRSRRWTTALPSMREAAKSLAASTGTLEVRSMQFCQEVLGFGQTVPFESREYFAGQKVILYYEVDNFDAERLTDGYETHLRGSYQILDTNGQLVAEQILQDDLQTCSNFRRDYFIAYVLHLPKRLAPGSYRFELTVEDVKGHTYGQASIPLDVKAL